jgi:hypothetical protein
MRRLPLALALVLLASPALAQQGRFECEESAYDRDTCTDPSDLETCRALDEPFRRETPAQRLLRFVEVVDGPYIGVGITMEAVSSDDDTRFAAARDRLCVPPPPPLVCPATPGTAAGGSSGGGVSRGPAWYGGNPGINVFFR